MTATNGPMDVRKTDTPQNALLELNRTDGIPWRKIALLDDYRGIPPGTLCTFAKTGYAPPRHRAKLGLPVSARVVSVGIAIPDNTLALSASRCECGRWFIPNHPRRKSCFICSPYRRR